MILKIWIFNFDGYGTIADWFGAIGTIGAVLVALMAPYYVNKPKIKASSQKEYFTPQMLLKSIIIKVVNNGQVPVKIVDAGFFIGRKHVNIPEEISEYLQQNDDIVKRFQPVGLFKSLISNYPDKQVFKLIPYARNSQGKYFKGKAVKFNRNDMDSEMRSIQQ